MNKLSTTTSARLAVLAAFFANGLLLATWVSRIPGIKQNLGMGEAALGLVLMGSTIGVLLALTVAGSVVGRFGSSRVATLSGLALSLSLPFVSLMPTPFLLFANLFVFGIFISTMDIAINAQAVAVEQRAGKPLMSSFHAFFSIGGLAGALLGSLMAGRGVSVLAHFTFAALLSVLILLVAARYYLRDLDETQDGGPLFRLPPRMLWGLGAVAFCVAIGEGAMTNWSGVYLAENVGTTAAFAALGYAAFSLTMTAGRLSGDWLAARFSHVSVVRAGGLVAALGLVAAMLAGNQYVVLAGFAVVGAGLANGIPLAFSVAGKYPGISSSGGIAGVATIGYAGFLAGPPVIGVIAEATSLRISLLVVALILGSLVFSAQAVRPRVQEPAAT